MQDSNVLIVWDSKWELGIPTIDVQHKHFVGLINSLYSCFKNFVSKEDVLPIIEDLVNYESIHFGTEEQYMLSLNYPEFEKHKAIHSNLKTDLLALIEKYKQCDSSDLMNLIDHLENWLVEHLITEDFRYKEHFLKANIK